MGEIEYPKTSVNTLGRKKERGSYDHAAISSIVNSTLVSHVSFNPPDSPFPTTLPMICRIGQSPTSTSPAAYIHGYISARMFKLPSSETTTSIPMCITATKVDGIVLASTPFNHSYHYRSAVLYGHATLLSPESPENMWAMELLTSGIVPARWENSRVPPTKAEMTSTRVLKVDIESASAKENVSGVKDDRKDLKDEEVAGRVWTGVVPVYEVVGEPVASATNRVEVPKYLSQWIEERNDEGRTEAIERAKPKGKKND